MKRLCQLLLAACAIGPLAIAVPAQAASSAASPGPGLGYSVAISGSTVVVGAPFEDSYRGAVDIYARKGTKWTRQAVLKLGGKTANWMFGQSVTISGSTILVGAPGADSNRGEVYVYVRKGTKWTRQAELNAAKGHKNAEFGHSVALSGLTAVVGAPGGVGDASVFVRTGTRWSRATVLPGPGGNLGPYNFGAAVAVSGSTVVVGWPSINAGMGSARVFVRQSGGWSEQATLNGSGNILGARFGASVAISGAVIVVGAPGGSPADGSAFIFTRSRGTWSKGTPKAGNQDGSTFGTSVSVSGSSIVIGAPDENPDQGAGYLYQHSGRKWIIASSLAAASPQSLYDNLFGFSVAVSGATAVVGAPGLNGDKGAVYVYVHSGAGWLQQAVL